MKRMLIPAVLLFIGSAVAGTAPTNVEQILSQYFLIHQSLAADSVNGVSQSAVAIPKISHQASLSDAAAKTQLNALSEAAARLQTNDLKTARKEFGDLSDQLITYLKTTGAKRNPPYQFYCPMVKKNWLQPDKQVRNPYYGSSMLTCELSGHTTTGASARSDLHTHIQHPEV